MMVDANSFMFGLVVGAFIATQVGRLIHYIDA